MKKKVANQIITLTLVIFTTFLGSKVYALDNMMVTNDAGLRTVTPVDVIKGKPFDVSFLIVKTYTVKDENGNPKQVPIMDYQRVAWSIKGCGININQVVTDPAKIVGQYPMYKVQGLFPSENTCTIEVFANAMPCERSSEGVCLNKDSTFAVPGKITFSKKANSLTVQGPSIISKAMGSANFTASANYSSAYKTIWKWRASQCSKSEITINGSKLSSSYILLLNPTAVEGSDCSVNVKAQVLNRPNGLDYVLDFLTGSKIVRIAK